MMKENMEGCCDLYDLDIDKGVNPTLAIQTDWIHEARKHSESPCAGGRRYV